MRTVVLAWYHTGFMDAPPELLAVCESFDVAKGIIEEHKGVADRTLEYRDRATYWSDEHVIRRKGDL